MEDRWHPKRITTAGSPFEVSLRVQLSIERFADRHGSFSRSGPTGNRPVDEATEESCVDGRVYPTRSGRLQGVSTRIAEMPGYPYKL